MIRFGCCTGAENYAEVLDAGFDAIELPGKGIAALGPQEFRELEKAMAQGTLPCCGFNASFPPQVRICGPEFQLSQAREYMKLLCWRGAALGCPGIGVGSPASRTLPAGYSQAQAWEQATAFLEALAEEAAPYGIQVLWEALNPTETNFGLSLAQSAQVIGGLRDQGVPNLWLVADLYHMSINGEGPQVLAACLPLVRHLHIAQRVGSQRRYPSREYVQSYRELLLPPVAQGYDGFLSTEAFDGQVAQDGPPALALLRELVAELRKKCLGKPQ